jgi:hypothetical protein
MTAPPTPHKLVDVFFFNYYKMFRANTSIGLYRPPAPSYGGGGGSFVILSFGMMLLLMLTVAFFLLLLYMRRKKREKTRAERIRELEDGMDKKRQNIRDAAAGAGLNDEDVDDILDSMKTTCLTFPINDVCDAKYYTLKDGCCVLKPGIQQSKESQQAAMLKKMGLEIGALMFTEILVTSVIPKMATRVKNVLKPVLRQIIKKTVSAMLARFAIKTALLIAKVLSKLSAGPVGWVLLIFDILSVVADTADLKNYDSFISNDGLMDMRDMMIYKFNEAMASIGNDYPVLFPFAEIFPEESKVVLEEVQGYLTLNYTDEFIEAGGVSILEKIFINELGDSDEKNDEEEQLKIFDKWNELIRTKDAKTIDKYMFDLLQQELPNDRKNDIFLAPSMSTVNTIGISVSEKAAEKWNKEQEEEWFTYLDPMFPPNKPNPEWSPPIMAVYTDKYLKLNKLNPGTQHNPRIMYDTLSQKVTLAYPFGPLFVMCEKSRTSMKYKKAIDPRDFGVKFNEKTGVCEYTKAYCNRYVIDHVIKTWGDGTSYHDCKLSKDQYWAEMFLGTSVVRDAKRYWSDPSNIGKDIGDNFENRKDKYGAVAATVMTIADPLGLYEGFVLNINEKLAGKDKYCVTGDTCKRFKAKHDGGNFMTWSARDKENAVYPNGMVGFQAQVKAGEDHEFFIPEGGQFRVKCDPGEGKYFSYDELPDNGETRNFTCWGGFVNKPAGEAVVAAVVDAAEETGEFFEDVGNATDKNVIQPIGRFLKKVFSDRRLKKNIKQYKDFYIWEWNDTARTLYGLQGKDFGYITDTIDSRYITSDSYGYEYIITESPVHKRLLKLKSQYKLKNG